MSSHNFEGLREVARKTGNQIAKALEKWAEETEAVRKSREARDADRGRSESE